MGISRRDFLKGGGAAAGALALSVKPANAAIERDEMRTKGLQSFTSICPYCGVGCGLLVHTKDGKIVNIEGDPEHPINEGSLCSKGSAMFQVANNDARLTTPLYRAPGSAEWQKISWEEANKKIAQRMKETRDRTFKTKEIRDGKEYLVNRNEGMACLGGAALDNEECYTWSKFARAMGTTWLEHQARI